ncbi:MAG: hypothetical protein A2664_00565 [Candidatus Taylorbacteria bacterium RIFCSPHIGHO2_01_FULL_46_22b]|uniref:AI-2E family transporter n=1 Tax=Candidatus Taylorbacteria bacterium RIFCSPHIGHO2_01_FULL_46_22b TaxID=1802301 RepID=A0A1G2M5T5_9BACT|nr:MAG: hypothetical protein A2664_00565 [Candidatus Taylorbacteria bacterium RIFCSPHIGHO2_01_FULL_46_22b]
MYTARAQTIFFVFLILTVLAMSFFIFQPYLTALFLAFVFFIVFKPLYHFVDRFCGGRHALSSLFTLALIIVLVFIPFLVFGSLLFDDARNLYLTLASGNYNADFLQGFERTLENYLSAVVPDVSIDIGMYVSQAASWFVDHLGSFFSGFMRFIVGLALMSLALFYFFKDSEAFKKKLLLYSPLEDAYDRDIFNHIERAVNSVVRGSLLIAFLQGVFIALGFWFTGIPNPVIFGAFGVVAALIPSFGTSLVLIPGIIFLFSTGSLIPAVILFAWGALVVGLLDNLLRPLLLTRSISIHPLLILLSVLGGISFFGLVGFIAGPVVVSLLYVLADLYPRIFGQTKNTA